VIRAAALLLAAVPAWAEPLLPSGLAVTAHDMQVERQPDGENWLVLRYLAPAIAGGAIGYADVTADLDQLCATEGLASAAAAGQEVAQIVIVLMDRAVPRGQPAPDATQYIGAYVLRDGECVWE
jgi:hypothetical protein